MYRQTTQNASGNPGLRKVGYSNQPGRIVQSTALATYRKALLSCALFVGGWLTSACTIYAQGSEHSVNARGPTWDAADKEVFFTDARHHLVGVREPTHTEKLPVRRAGGATQIPWSTIIEGDALITEVKRLHQSLQVNLTSLPRFRAGGHFQCRTDYSLLAVLFQVIATYDADVRWKDAADAVKSLCLSTSEACLHSSDEAFDTASQTLEVINDLIRGQSLRGASWEFPSEEAQFELSIVMQRMDRSEKLLQASVPRTLARDERETGDAVHEAKILAMLARVIQGEEYYFADDTVYLDHAESLRLGAQALGSALLTEDHPTIAAEVKRVSQSCIRCHEEYRG